MLYDFITWIYIANYIFESFYYFYYFFIIKFNMKKVLIFLRKLIKYFNKKFIYYFKIIKNKYIKYKKNFYIIIFYIKNKFIFLYYFIEKIKIFKIKFRHSYLIIKIEIYKFFIILKPFIKRYTFNFIVLLDWFLLDLFLKTGESEIILKKNQNNIFCEYLNLHINKYPQNINFRIIYYDQYNCLAYYGTSIKTVKNDADLIKYIQSIYSKLQIKDIKKTEIIHLINY